VARRTAGSARSGTRTDAEAERVQYDLRSVITTWGGRDMATGLHDYAERELSGLVRDLYLPRWQTCFATLEAALTGGGAPAPIDWFAVEDSWIRQRTNYPATPAGDPHQVAATVWGFLTAADSLPPM
jgi:alpha-N-acetylglucosaminidase